LASTLSHGQRQWLEIGMVLSASPRLMLLDEPTAGMTAAETAATVDLIKDIAASGDVTVFVIEHDMGFLERLGGAVSVMAKGRVVRTGTYAELRADPVVQSLYFGGTVGASA
jgi:urea transport system ATP-binding protein